MLGALGWGDIEADRRHHETGFGLRFAMVRSNRDRMLGRLLELNHERYAAEVAAGLHDKKAKKSPAKRSSKSAANQDTLL